MGWAAACCCAIWLYAIGLEIAVVEGWPWLTEGFHHGATEVLFGHDLVGFPLVV
jgi:hypothetical protein